MYHACLCLHFVDFRNDDFYIDLHRNAKCHVIHHCDNQVFAFHHERLSSSACNTGFVKGIIFIVIGERCMGSVI